MSALPVKRSAMSVLKGNSNSVENLWPGANGFPLTSCQAIGDECSPAGTVVPDHVVSVLTLGVEGVFSQDVELSARCVI